MKDINEKKLKIKEEIIENNYYLTMAMIKEDTSKILYHKEKINKLIKNYLNLLTPPLDFI